MTSTIASAVRPGLRDNRQTSSPHTPTRFISSNFSSPGSTFRQEEDAIVVELGSRYLRAGFEGESDPQCLIPFGQDNGRVGDYRVWTRGYKSCDLGFEDWSKTHELWQNNLKDVDLGLIEDKLERAVREVYNKYLLTDAGIGRLVLVLPSVFPHPLLTTVLTALFERWNYSTITLLPTPTMSAISSGLRSALVVDIGWEETVVTSVYEYRELRTTRSTRGMKMLVQRMGAVLRKIPSKSPGELQPLPINFDLVEEIIIRAAISLSARKQREGANDQVAEKIDSHALEEGATTLSDQREYTDSIEVEWPFGTSSTPVTIPLKSLSNCVDSTFLKSEAQGDRSDDHELTLPELIYRALTLLTPDVRGICMSRIVFVGGGSHIAGLSARVLDEVDMIVKEHGWTHVRGKKHRRKQGELSQGGAGHAAMRHDAPLPAEKDYVEAKLQKQRSKNAQSETSGVLRQVESLGAWAGASLLISLKIKGFVEIERERYLSHGLAGASRETEISVVAQRMTSFGVSGAKSHERAGWTLGGWA